MLAATILAAGESSRMGHPKALLPFPAAREDKSPGNPQTFLEHLIEVPRHPRIGALRVVLGAAAEEIRKRVPLDESSVVVNAEWRKGQLTSLQAAIRSLPPETEGLLVCLVDHPLISTQVVATLVAAFDGAKSRIVIPTYRGRRGHPVIFPSALFGELLRAPLDVGARAVVRAHAADIVEAPTKEEGVVLNLNDLEALDRARKILGTAR